MSSLPRHSSYFNACYQRNATNGCRAADSQLICLLKESKWVPQDEGEFVRPEDALRVLLPAGFPYDDGYEC